MKPFLVVLALLPALPPATVLGAHPNNSIDPKPPPPTRYGLTIARSDDTRFLEVPPELVAPATPRAELLALVESAELASGPYSPNLVPPLEQLARSLQADGRHRAAIDQYRRALHLSRVNDGLYDPAQIPLLQQLASSQVALGRYAQADQTRDYLFRVQRAVYPVGSDALDAAVDAHAEWKREAYLEGFGYETYVQLLDMHRSHDDAIEQIASADPWDPAQIPHLYQRMRSEYLLSRYEGEEDPVFQVRGSGFTGERYAINTSMEREEFRLLKKHNFRNGRRTMEQVLAVLAHQDTVAPKEVARAYVARGDWFMWWDQPARALDAYEKAWAALDADVGAPGADWFAEPVELPEDEVFQPAAQSDSAAFNARARVRFGVSRLGQVRNIEFLEVEAETEEKRETARLALYRMLKDFRFRPLLRDGQAVDVEDVVREYSFEY